MSFNSPLNGIIHLLKILRNNVKILGNFINNAFQMKKIPKILIVLDILLYLEKYLNFNLSYRVLYHV